MKRLLFVVGLTVVIAALAWAPPAPVQAAGPQAAAKPAQEKKAPEKPAAGKKADQAKPTEAKKPLPSVPSDFKAIMDAADIADPVKRAEATQKAIMALYSKQMGEAPDRKAYTEALRLTDPAKKLEALQKFLKDFPKSAGVSMVNTELLGALVADASKRVLDHANAMIEAVPETSPTQGTMARAAILNTVANRLMVAGFLLDDAEKFVTRSIALYDEQKYIESNRKMFQDMIASMAKASPDRKPPAVPTDAELRQQFLSTKAVSETTLGEIYLKQGRVAEAEKQFRKIHAEMPTKAIVTMYLADLAKKAGRDAELLSLLTEVALAGGLPPDRRKDLDAAYRKAHKGSLDGLEEMLDAGYEKANPKPAVKPYVRDKARTDRVVLAEIFTGAGCPPCVGADLAFEGALDRYSGQELAVLMYHLHIPRPDPMTNPSTQARSKFYGVQGVPAFYVDGVTDGRGGGAASAAPTIYKERVEPVVDKRLATKAGAKVTVQVAMTGSVVNVKVDVGKPAGAAKHLKLQVALVEERIRYAGENGVRFHPMVVRSLAGKDGQGFALEAGKGLRAVHAFDLSKIAAEAKAHLDDFEAKSTTKYLFAEKKHEMNTAKLAVVAFVQDEDTKQVLQSAYVKVGPAAGKAD